MTRIAKAKKIRNDRNAAWQQALREERVVRWIFEGEAFRLTSYPTIFERDCHIAARPATYDYEIITDYNSDTTTMVSN